MAVSISVAVFAGRRECGAPTMSGRRQCGAPAAQDEPPSTREVRARHMGSVAVVPLDRGRGRLGLHAGDDRICANLNGEARLFDSLAARCTLTLPDKREEVVRTGARVPHDEFGRSPQRPVRSAFGGDPRDVLLEPPEDS
jgi:hypothetical protein